MTPKKVMTQLVEAALDNDAQGVYALLASGEPVEMPGIALCRAISSGSRSCACGGGDHARSVSVCRRCSKRHPAGKGEADAVLFHRASWPAR